MIGPKYKTHFKKPIILAVLALVIGLVAGWFILRERSVLPSSKIGGSNQPTTLTGKPAKIRFIATGDIIAHDSVNINAKSSGSYDYLKLMSNLKPYFDKADIRFCNQATPAGGEKFGISGYPIFNAPLQLTRDMVKLGCNVVNLGTNHTNDKGQALIDAVVDEWDKQDILAYAGANRSPIDRDSIKYFDVKGVKFAFLSYSTYTNSPISNGYGVTMYSRNLAKAQLAEANKNAEIVIVSIRWGTEYSPKINESQAVISQDLAYMGADIVLGHGSHVLQPVKKLKGASGNETLVWYSLGNFLNTQLETEALTGAIGIMDIDIQSKKITNISALPIYMHYEWTADEKARGDLLARHNIAMYPLDQAAGQIARSQLNTTVEAQTKRITDVLNQYTEVKIIKSSQY